MDETSPPQPERVKLTPKVTVRARVVRADGRVEELQVHHATITGE
jgi:hypothetical protein